MKVVAVSDPECGEVLMVSRDIVINRPPVIVKVKNFNYGLCDLRNRLRDSYWLLPGYNADKVEILSFSLFFYCIFYFSKISVILNVYQLTWSEV